MKSNSITLFATLLVVAGGGAGPSNTAAAATRPPEYQRATTALSPSYPLFSQCDAKWADDEMGVPGAGERATICKEGCAMSCVAMALAGHRIYINNSEVRCVLVWMQQLQCIMRFSSCTFCPVLSSGHAGAHTLATCKLLLRFFLGGFTFTFSLSAATARWILLLSDAVLLLNGTSLHPRH